MLARSFTRSQATQSRWQWQMQASPKWIRLDPRQRVWSSKIGFSNASGDEEVSIQGDDTPLEVQEVRNITPAARVALAELGGVNLSEEFSGGRR